MLWAGNVGEMAGLLDGVGNATVRLGFSSLEL